MSFLCSMDIIESFEKYLKLDYNLEVYINNHIAHSSSVYPKSEKLPTITLLKIQSQMRVSIWGITQIGKIIDEFIPAEVPYPQFDVLNNWDKGLFNEKIKNKLYSYWEKRMEWWSKWLKHYNKSDRFFISPYERKKDISV